MKPGGLLTRLWGEARTSQPEPGSTIAAPDSASPPASSPRPESSASLLLTWEEAVELIRSRRGDVFEIQFLGREVDRLRASEDPALGAKAEVAREHLQAVIERKLRAKDLLPPTGELELVDAAH